MYSPNWLKSTQMNNLAPVFCSCLCSLALAVELLTELSPPLQLQGLHAELYLSTKYYLVAYKKNSFAQKNSICQWMHLNTTICDQSVKWNILGTVCKFSGSSYPLFLGEYSVMLHSGCRFPQNTEECQSPKYHVVWPIHEIKPFQIV